MKTTVKSSSQCQMVPQNLRTQNTKLVAVAQTLQGAFFSFSLLRNDCRVCTQASLQLNITISCYFFCQNSTALKIQHSTHQIIPIVSDSSRDPEEGTTSDTTIDSPINGPPLPDGTSSSRPSLNGNLLVPGHATNGHKRVGKKHKKGRKNKENGRAEQKPLFNGGASSCNGNNKKNEMSRASGMESQCCPNNRNGSAGHHLEHVEEHSLNSQVESQVMSKLARSDSLTESEVQNVTSS